MNRPLKLSVYLAATLAFCQALSAETISLKNGDKISGEVIAKSDDCVYLKTAFGTIKLPTEQIEPAKEVAQSAENAEAKLAKDDSAKAQSTDATVAASADKKAEETPKAYTWVDSYRDFIHANVPEGWDFMLKGGLDYRKTSSKTLSYTFSFDAHTAWDDLNDFKFNAYYEYASETSEAGIENCTTDKYGLSGNYKRYFEEDNTWYMTDMLSYGVDTVKGIKDQAEEMVGFGRTIKFLDDKLVMNLAVGPSIRYINAVNYDNHWAALATFSEDLAYDFHEYARFEQNMYIGENMLNVHQYNFVFGMGLVFKLSDLFNLAARYYYSYDAINSSEAQKSEQRLIFGFEIPLK